MNSGQPPPARHLPFEVWARRPGAYS